MKMNKLMDAAANFRKISVPGNETTFSKISFSGLGMIFVSLVFGLSLGTSEAVGAPSAPAKSAASPKAPTGAEMTNQGVPLDLTKKIIDIGELQIEGELRRPNMQWLDSSKRMREHLARIYVEQFRRLEDEMLRPITQPEFEVELQKEERLGSN